MTSQQPKRANLWDGTMKSFADAFGRLSGGNALQTDLDLVHEVVAAAVVTREVLARLSRLEAAVREATSIGANESKRTRNEMDALEAEVKRLTARLNEHGR
jgi:hypothetical protein